MEKQNEKEIIKLDNDKKIEEEFNELVDSLSDKQFNDWVMSWFDIEYITDIYMDWDIETKKEEIKKLKEIKNKKNLNIVNELRIILKQGENINGGYEDAYLFLNNKIGDLICKLK